MDTLLTHLRDLRADSFPKGGNLADFGLAKPAYRFSIQYGDKNATEIVEAGNPAITFTRGKPPTRCPASFLRQRWMMWKNLSASSKEQWRVTSN
jgi:hypothetical protein